ncbi:DNA translocase FtsK [Sedimentibacter hydroxybenzoicus DSM 7310]|uniref:DNA translocase FtsK n=1 Tax=Sedimentibacter hydroxybenzoicus DSM 7310 TaxID=1123245 RepID=A0A974BIX1_SEDHY|nr:DNA translocase FtsK [Sedimentibacter hydroxybenzoicus]NYB73607.1 DNA translocase FtsK [Sedimentibacter hydroxybenzoicus DSM 7310]
MAKVQTESKSKKTSTRKKSTSTNQIKKADILKKEIIGIFIVAFAVFLIVVTNKENQTGIIGKSINVFTHSIFGKGADILPYFILTIGVMRLLNIVILNDNNQIIAIIGFFICYIIYVSISDAAILAILKGNTNLQELFSVSVDTGLKKVGGGIIGNVLTYIFVKLLDKNGTYIVLGALVFSNIVLFTNQSIIGIFKLFAGYIKKFSNAIYNFVFTESTDEDNNKKPVEKHSKNQAYDTADNIQIYDYLNPADNNKKAEITQLKIDDIKKPAANAVQIDAKKQEDTEPSEKEKKINPKEKFEPQAITDDIINIAGVKSDKYKMPPTTLLDPLPQHSRGDKDDLKKDGEKLIETLNNFNIPCNILQINKGPTITRYEIQPAPGIKVSRITGLSNDIALALATSDIRMEAPIPGKAAIGIEVPNKSKTSVYLRSLIESKEYKTVGTNIPFALGKDIAGKNIIASIDKMPHLLIAGATGSGKSVCINSLIMSILFKARPDEVKLILIDPKVVELSVYNGLPHLLIPVVTDPRKAANALNWAVSEMTSRYKVFAQNSVRDIATYNEKMVKEGNDKMPQIVIVIDELADLMTVASSEVEEYITRIAQLARACGMHLVIATQRPSVDVITGVIKANIPSRIAFAVSSHIDSRTILDTGGAEKLLGRGDMLYHPIGLPKPIRIQGTFISDDEIKRVVDSIKEQQIEIKTNKQNEIINEIEKAPNSDEEVDELLEQAVEMVVMDGQASASYIQRKFKVGYARAARIIDQLEERGIVGGHEGSKPRKVLITKEELDEMRGN